MRLPFAGKPGTARPEKAGERTSPIELAPGNSGAFIDWLTAYRERLNQLNKHEEPTRDPRKEE
jgi:hypothetical protein